MTEGEENIIIKGVLLEAISRDFSEELSNNKEVSVSPRFKRQMMAMMNNPNKWAERHKRDYRRRFVKVVATIVLTCSLPFGVLTVASPTVRAAVIDWVVEWYESSIIYKFFGESDSTKLPLYEVIDLPFDYTRIGIPQELPSLAYSNPKKLMDAELDYLIVSMNTVGNWFKPDNNQSKYGTSETLTASQFKVSNKSADILARIFCGHYERPGVPKISERVANAKKWYNFL